MFARIFMAARNCYKRQETPRKKGKTCWEKKDFHAHVLRFGISSLTPSTSALLVSDVIPPRTYIASGAFGLQRLRGRLEALRRERTSQWDEREGEDQYVHEVGCVERERVTLVLSVKDYREAARL